jgi:hypothetical protein
MTKLVTFIETLAIAILISIPFWAFLYLLNVHGDVKAGIVKVVLGGI